MCVSSLVCVIVSVSGCVVIENWLSYCWVCVVFFFKQKTAYEMRISDWSSDVCSSDLLSPSGTSQISKDARKSHILGPTLNFSPDLAMHWAMPSSVVALRDRKSTRLNSSH